jgi:uncharacterized protein (DUF1501 family)
MSLSPAVNAILPAEATRAANTASNRKAFVTVFLAGGNDTHNTVFPVSEPDYGYYKSSRSDIAFDKTEGIPITPAGWTGPNLRLHPSLINFARLFNNGRALMVSNVGNLVQPMTNVQLNYPGTPTVNVPTNLYSHSDQTEQLLSGRPNGPPTDGYFGRFLDCVTPAFNTGPVSGSISAGVNAIGMTGVDTAQYQISPAGALKVTTGWSGDDTAVTAYMQSVLRKTSDNPLKQAYLAVGKRSLDSYDTVANALAGVTLATSFPNTGLGRQLQIIAKLIKVQAGLGHRRDAFFAQQGGYDFHSNLRADQAARLLELDEAVSAFDDEMVAQGRGDTVVLSVVSEFGRTQEANGDGSDHGFGQHVFTFGGNLKGNRIHGVWPGSKLGDPWDGGQGRMVPTVSWAALYRQYALWFDVVPDGIPFVVPGIANFPGDNLALFN